MNPPVRRICCAEAPFPPIPWAAYIWLRVAVLRVSRPRLSRSEAPRAASKSRAPRHGDQAMLDPHVTETLPVPPPPAEALRVGAAGTRPELAAPPPIHDSELGSHGTTTSDPDGW